MRDRYDTVIVGAGIAGLGVGAILAGEGRQKILVVDRLSKPGGRLMTYSGYPESGWTVDLGLHFIELGEKGSCSDLNRRVGKSVKWGPVSRSVDIWNGERFMDLGTLVPMTDGDRDRFRDLLRRISMMEDGEIEDWDNRSLAQWLARNVPRASIRELFAAMGMIMTTIPDPGDMAAGEVLYIARENLQKTRQVLQAGYPLEGMAGIIRGLVEAIRECGGDLLLNREVAEVVLEKGRATGVRLSKRKHPYPGEFRLPATELVRADRVVCGLPIYQLHTVLDLNSRTGPLPQWWIKRIRDIRHEITGLVGCMIGLREPVVDPDRHCFFTARETRRAGLPFQGFAASNFSPHVAPRGKQLLHTDLVCEHDAASDPFQRRGLLVSMWKDLEEMFPGVGDLVEWRLPYYVDGCDGLARKPGLVGRFKPELSAPGVADLFFAGDTYQGRGLAANGAARSAMMCADLILE